MINPHTTLADIVLDHSECAEVLSRHRLDFCCRGDQPLEVAARRRGLDVDELIHELAQAIEKRHSPSSDDPRALATKELISLIVSRHHEYLREVLPFVATLAAKVSRVHGGGNPKLHDLNQAVVELREELGPHLEHEEETLFPALLEDDKNADQVTTLLAAMADEHQSVGELLARIRAASDDFTLPDGACRSYRTLFAELADLEADIFAHVHLENHVLKPRFA